MDPKISGAVPQWETKWRLNNDDTRVWSRSEPDVMWVRVAGSWRDLVRRAGPKLEVCM